MPINRYQIRNVYSLADPELYKASDKDDPEALLEGVAMAGLVGVLRQLGDLAEFAAEIFHDLHEEVMATAARGHGLLVRVQQLESEIPPIERAFLSQTSHSTFFLNSGAHWHPNQRTTQNLITTGDFPRFVMDSYEECRAPPRLFLLDKFDVGGAGACLKRYTDPSIFKAEASSYEIEIAETQREKKIHQTKKKGSRWKGGKAPEVSQSSHAKLHQLFLEERVQTDASEAARRVKLKKRPNKFPLDSESGESYMNKLLDSASRAHEVTPAPSNGSRLDDGSIMGSALGSPMKNTSPCVSSRKITESHSPYDDELEVDNNQTTVDNEIRPDGLQNAYPSEDVASETDNYMDARATIESEVETSITQRTYFDANKHQLQSQLSDSLIVENSTVSNDGNNSITKGISVSGNSDTTSTSTENASTVGTDSPSQPFACVEIPFRPRSTPITDNIHVTQNPGHDITKDTCIGVSKVSNVDQVASLEDGTLDTNEVCSDHTEKLDSSRKSDDHQIDTKDTAKCTSEHSDVLPVADGLSFSFDKNLKGDLENKYPNDSSIPTSLLPNILERTKNQTGYDLENHSTDSVVSSSQSVISRVDELSSDTTFNDDNSVTEEQLKEKGGGVLVISDQAEARVSYSSGHETGSHNSEIEPVSVAVVNTNRIDDSVLKEGTGTESEERELESTYSDNKRDDGKGLGDDTKLERIEADTVKSDMEKRCSVLQVDGDRHDNTSHSVSEQDSKESGEKQEVNSPLLNSKILQNHNNSFLAETDQNQEIILPDFGSQPVDSEPCVSNAQLIDSSREASAFTESDSDLESKSPNHIDILEAKVDQSNNQLHMQLPPETDGSQLVSLTQVDHETLIETHLDDSQSFSESVPVSEKPSATELSSHEIISDQDDIIAPCQHQSNVFTEADHDVESKSLNHGYHIDVSEAPSQSSLVEDKVDQPIGQLHVPVPEKSSTMELSTHDINLSDQVKHQSSPVLSGFDILPQLPPVKVEDPPPLPPLPPMQWRMRKLQSPLSTPTNGGQHSENPFHQFFSSTSIQNPEVVGQSTIDETINLDTENQKSHTQHNEVKSAETLVPQAAAVDPHRMPTVSYQEAFWPSSSPYPLPPILDEMQINVRPMKIQRPRSPLIDAVAAHDKTKLRKVSDRDTIHIPKGDEKDTLLDQIRAKSINLKPAVQTRPSIQGPTTNLRVAAILEKANAIRQAFAGSDDDDSDHWSDS